MHFLYGSFRKKSRVKLAFVVIVTILSRALKVAILGKQSIKRNKSGNFVFQEVVFNNQWQFKAEYFSVFSQKVCESRN